MAVPASESAERREWDSVTALVTGGIASNGGSNRKGLEPQGLEPVVQENLLRTRRK